MNSTLKKSESSFIFHGQKKEFLDWLESLRISKYWLDTISHVDSYALCKEIYQVLKNFKGLELADKEKVFALIEINSCLQGVYEKLQLSYLNAKLPLNKEQQDDVKIIINAYMELANAYHGILLDHKTTKTKLSEQHLALTACKGLQGLGVVFLSSAQIYTDPPKNFWLLCYHLFSAAEGLNLLDHKIKIDNEIHSAAILFKQLIVFYVIDKNKYAAIEIAEIFQSLFRGINYIQSYILAMVDTGTSSSSTIFGFSLIKDEPPSIQNNVPLATAKLLRYVEKSEIVKIVQFMFHETKEKQLGQLLAPEEKKQRGSVLNPELFSRMLITLEHEKHKHQRRISKQYSCRAILGIDNLVDFFLERDGKKSAEVTQKTGNDFEDDLDSLQMILDWDSEKKSAEAGVIVEELQIIDSSMSGYGIHWNNNIIGKLQIGEVIGIIPGFNSSRKGVEIGLIRRIRVTGNNIVFGVELIGLETTLIQVERDNSYAPAEWLLFLFGSPNYDVGVLCHKERNYQAGEAIFVVSDEKKVPCRLGSILNSTPLLDHLAIVY